VLSPSDAGIHDCVVVQELLKEVAQSHTLDATGQKDFKGIVFVSSKNVNIIVLSHKYG